VCSSDLSTAIGGLSFGAQLFLEPWVPVTVQAGARLDVGLLNDTNSLLFNLSARYGFFDFGPFNVGLTLQADLVLIAATKATAPDGSNTDNSLRLTVGPSLVARAPRSAVGGGEVPQAIAPSVVGVVRGAQAQPLVGATVTAGSTKATTDENGRYELSGLAPGPATLTASAPGHKPATAQVIVTKGTPVERAFTLAPPTGPGRITGVVKALAPSQPPGATEPVGAPIANATVTSGSASVTTNETGTFTLERVGPGPVKVKVTLQGYAAANEVVQVAPEATAQLDVMLEPVTARTKAKLRGVISSAAGPVAKATVRVVELKVKQAVKADGRFEADVPGGKYTLVIEAPKHVTQTRVVEVADGDQAIFQIELEKVR
jgi:hypothetical protein